MVKFLYDRGVTDPETLSLPNRLKGQDAIGLLANLVATGRGLRGDELRQCAAMQTARALVDPAYNPDVFTTAFIPTLTDERYNAFIVNALGSNPEKLPETYRLMALRVTDEVRTRYGAKGLPDGAGITRLSADRPDLSPEGTPASRPIPSSPPTAKRPSPRPPRPSWRRTSPNAWPRPDRTPASPCASSLA